MVGRYWMEPSAFLLKLLPSMPQAKSSVFWSARLKSMSAARSSGFLVFDGEMTPQYGKPSYGTVTPTYALPLQLGGAMGLAS